LVACDLHGVVDLGGVIMAVWWIFVVDLGGQLQL
jgi:hypothetical protein